MARSAVLAFEEYARPLEAALACVAQIHTNRGKIRVGQQRLFAPQPGIIRLRRTGNRSPLHLNVLQSYQIIHDRTDTVRGPFYAYVISWTYAILTAHDRELLVYRWHPQSEQPAPHLHVGSVLLDTNSHDLAKGFSMRHIATGYVPLQRIVRMLIEEFDVDPLRGDWAEVLSAPDSPRS